MDQLWSMATEADLAMEAALPMVVGVLWCCDRHHRRIK